MQWILKIVQFFLCIFVQGRWQHKPSQLIQDLQRGLTDVYDTTLNTEQNLLTIKLSADN